MDKFKLLNNIFEHDTYYKCKIPNKLGTKNTQINSENLEIVVVDDFKFCVHKKDDCITSCLKSGVLWEKYILTLLRHFINPELAILDIGANIGNHSVIFANYTNKKVYAFEPQYLVYDILLKNLELNNCTNVIPHNFGLSNKNDKFYMNCDYTTNPTNNFGAFRICDELDASNGLEITCKIFDELDIKDDIGFIKIDVEDHELEALIGLKSLITRCQPILLIEIHDTSTKKTQLLDLLNTYGYKSYFKFSHCDYLFITK